MKRHLALAAAIAAAFAPPVLAASSANVTLSNFTVTLIDLNPADSVTPGITWTTLYPGYGSYASGNAYDYSSGNYQTFTELGTQNWSSISGSIANNFSAAHASVTAGNDPGNLPSGASVSAGGSAAGTAVLGNGAYSTFQASSSATYFSGSFSLTPQTLAVFSVVASGNATTTVGYQTNGSATGSEYAQSIGSLSVTGSGPGGQTGSQSSTDSFSLYAIYEYTYTYDPSTGQYVYNGFAGQTRSFSGSLSGSYLNYSDTYKDGSLYLSAGVGGSSSVAAVPEPETYALMLAGLGLVGLISRRRLARAA